jgi:hypothetical protein
MLDVGSDYEFGKRNPTPSYLCHIEINVVICHVMGVYDIFGYVIVCQQFTLMFK